MDHQFCHKAHSYKFFCRSIRYRRAPSVWPDQVPGFSAHRRFPAENPPHLCGRTVQAVMPFIPVVHIVERQDRDGPFAAGAQLDIEGRRGWQMSLSTDSRHGNCTRVVSRLCGRSASTTTVPFSARTIRRTLATLGMPSHSAISGPTWAVSPSVVCLPQIRRSKRPARRTPCASAGLWRARPHRRTAGRESSTPGCLRPLRTPADDRLRLRRPHAEDRHAAAVFLLQAQRRFKRVQVVAGSSSIPRRLLEHACLRVHLHLA